MFIGQQKEVKSLINELSSMNKKSAILIYGKRRVGKYRLLAFT